MVCARLHIICGNCGCNDMWKWKHIPEVTVSDKDIVQVVTEETVFIYCGNCSTIHDLNNNARRR